MKYIKLFLVLLLMVFAPAALAQANCSAIVKAAMDEIDNACLTTGRNQVCYGNIQLTATPRTGASLTFDKTGDIANVVDLEALKLSSMSLTDESWGVALMRLQANLAGTLPGQNVTFLLFGNVQIDNAVKTPIELSMTTLRGVNVRLRPTTATNNVIASLKPGETVTANGRLKDSSWVRVKLDSGMGWVSADFLKGTSDLKQLLVVEAGTPSFGPMQAFTFNSGLHDRPCDQAPDSGILIQTPKGGTHVTFEVNDVQITLGSTVYLQSQPNDFMTVTVVEGQATLTVNGQSQRVPAGTFSQVPLDEAGNASGSAAYPKPYDAQALQTLPLRLRVFDTVEIAAPLTTAQIKATLEPVVRPTAQPAAPANNGNAPQSSDLPLTSKWNQTQVITTNTCDPTGSNAVGVVSRTPGVTLTFNQGRDQLVWGGWETHNMSRIGDNVYQSVSDYNHLTITVTFTSPTSYHFSWVGIYPEYNGTPACTYIMDGGGVRS